MLFSVRRSVLEKADSRLHDLVGRVKSLLVVTEGETWLLEIESGIELVRIPESRLTWMNDAGTSFCG